MAIVACICCDSHTPCFESLTFKTEDIRKYFPKSYTSLDMQKTIITLLEKWQRQRERNRGEER